MTTEAALSPDLAVDPALEVAERQLVMLRELAELAMGVSRAFAASASESAKAEKTILADEYFIPEVGRARACGAKDAAESFQKVSRAVRLTLMLEMTVAETVRDLRAGIVAQTTRPKHANETPAVLETALDRRCPAGSSSNDRETDVTRSETDAERLVDVEAPDRLPRGSYCRLVDDLAADISAAVDWDRATVSAPALGAAVPPRNRRPIWRVGALADPTAPHHDLAKGIGGGADPPTAPVRAHCLEAAPRESVAGAPFR